jgi:hypothetical protein
MNLKKQFMEGLLTQNPVLVLVLGMCSTMAITTSFFQRPGHGRGSYRDFDAVQRHYFRDPQDRSR